MAVNPRTKPILAILEPITLPKEISENPSIAACRLTKSSGAEVAKETTVRPTTILEILSFSDIATELRTKNSPPITKRTKPTIRNTTLIDDIFCEDRGIQRIGGIKFYV